MNEPFRTETDSMGAMQVPAAAYYGAQTARAVENCKYQELTFWPFFSQWISRRSRTAHRRTGDALRDRAGADIERAALSVIVEVKTVTIIGLTLWSL
jgi:aspartate ammonia-lyase